MSRFSFREEESDSNSALYIAIGALAGFAAGVLVAEQFGGFRAITGRIRERFGGEDQDLDDYDRDSDDLDNDLDEDDVDDYSAAYVAPIKGSDELEERVLEAYRNDPIL